MTGVMATKRSVVLAASATAAGLLIVGCGGQDAQRPAKTTATPSATVSQTPTAGKVAQLSVRVGRVGGGTPVHFGSAVRAQTGDSVQILVSVRSATRNGALVRIGVPRRPGPQLTVSASGGGKTTHASIEAAAGTAIRLTNPRYSCTLPPNTVCPASHVRVAGRAYGLTFKVPAGSLPIVLSALVA